ncbi:hypothetical protein J2W34_006548 [Variovorax boronicumulans]|uniref:DUF2000 domain-containing protein n=1 Tax=Variovorax TaxID=34072 RepID=UPI00278A429C|nr:DUF2000 domain-containing protein [Variovorax boronicumulans]MDQ0074722.1 hypothetical protein [Variovorax boronicumulans]
MLEAFGATPERSVIIINNELPIGKAANAAAVVAFTLGQRHPSLVGEQFKDGTGTSYPGVIFTGISILGASPGELIALSEKAAANCDVVVFPLEGQTTVDYEEFRRVMADVTPERLGYLSIGLAGHRKSINKIVGNLKLLR